MMPTMMQDYYVWNCPHCKKEWRTNRSLPNRMHPCPKKGGLLAPMVPNGIRAMVEVVWREDYVGKEIVTKDDRGRVPMAMRTNREHGQDIAVFAPHARASLGGVDRSGSRSALLHDLRIAFWRSIRKPRRAT